MINPYPALVLPPRRHPLLRLVSAFPIAGFPAALTADIAYASSANVMWADFADWLLAASMLMGVLAAIIGLGVLIADRRLPRSRPTGLVVLGSLVALALGLLDNFVHSRDAWTSVVPWGLALSAATTIVVFVTVWLADGAYRTTTTTLAGVRTA